MTDKNQNIPPLLPLEYCTVERAARLLGCEVEDIHHWRKIGAVKVYVHFDKQVIGNVTVLMTEIENHNLDIANSYLRGLEKRIKDYWDQDMDAATGFKHMVLKQMHRALLVGKFDDHFPERGASIKFQPICPMGVFSEHGKAYWEHDNCLSQERSFSASSAITGFWEADSISHSSENDVFCWSDEIETTWGDNLRSVQISVDKSDWDGNYYLIRRDLLKLHYAIHGLNELKTRYNDPDIAQKMREQEKQANEKPTRVRSEQIALTQELVKRVLNIDTIEQPSKLAEALLKELSSSGSVQDLPDVRTVTRYLGGK